MLSNKYVCRPRLRDECLLVLPSKSIYRSPECSGIVIWLCKDDDIKRAGHKHEFIDVTLYIGKGGWDCPFRMISWPPRSLQPSSLCFIAPLQPGVNHFSAVICQEFLSLFCCHFITGSSYQPAQSHVTGLSLSWVPILLIRDHHEMGWMVYRGSLMLKKEQSPFSDVPVTFWIIGFCVCSWWTAP